MRVFVYYNLHKNVWSVKALSGPNKGRVIAHTDTVLLKNAIGRVSKAGRERVLKEKRKNVHAGIVGELVNMEKNAKFSGSEITYNPYKFSSFVFKSDTEKAFNSADSVYMDTRRVFVSK